MFGALTRLLRRDRVKSLDIHMPDLHLRDLRWEDVAAFARGAKEPRESRAGVLLPTALTLAGAGAALWWWREWAQGRAEADAADTPGIAAFAPRATADALDASLAVQGDAETSSSGPKPAQVELEA